MKLSLFGRLSMALFASLTLGLGMTACGGGTIGYMWVLGQQYNTIAGFKIDDYTGNLTQIINAPFNANGVTPVSIVVKPGGRYVYVINQGTGGGPQLVNGVAAFVKGTSANIAEFSVGGDGVLTFQQAFQTQGYVSQWAQMDSTGNYLYVLDKYSPNASAAACLSNAASALCQGTITAFSSDSGTGRLTLITNSQTQTGSLNTPSFDVGVGAFMMKSSGGCLFTVNGATQTYTGLGVSTGGQLVIETTGTSTLGTNHATSINGNGSLMFVTDNNAPAGTVSATPGYVNEFSIGTGCTLLSAGSGRYQIPSIVGGINPVYSIIDTSGKFFYVLNNATTNTQTSSAFSTISAFTFTNTTSGTQLQPINEGLYTVGSGPVCVVEDPTNQYLYISNFNDGTVTGKTIDNNTGILSDLTRGSTFTAVGHAGCLVLSGSVN